MSWNALGVLAEREVEMSEMASKSRTTECALVLR